MHLIYSGKVDVLAYILEDSGMHSIISPNISNLIILYRKVQNW